MQFGKYRKQQMVRSARRACPARSTHRLFHAYTASLRSAVLPNPIHRDIAAAEPARKQKVLCTGYIGVPDTSVTKFLPLRGLCWQRIVEDKHLNG
jgi:hypothetical protein